MCQNQQANFFIFLLTEDSLKAEKDLEGFFKATIFVEFFVKKFWFVIWHKRAKFHH